MLALIGLFVKLASRPPVAVHRRAALGSRLDRLYIAFHIYDSKALIFGYLCWL